MNLALHKERLLRALGRKEATFRAVSEKEWTIRPALSSTVPPAIFSESDLDRITAVMENTTLEWELARIRGGRREHAATLAFQISDVELRDGCLSKGPWLYRLLKSPGKSPRNTPVEIIPDAAIACTLFGGIYFAHWITDDLTLHMAAAEIARPLTVQRKPYHHEPDYLRIFGIENAPTARARFSRFVMIEDFGQNAFKEDRYRLLRSRLRAACPNPGANRKIYLRRGTKGAPRTLVNTQEIEDYLSSEGFLLIDPDHSSPTEIAQLANGAQIAISVEGSQMVHGLMNLADGGSICQIQPPYRFNNLFKDYTDCLGMRYAFAVGQTAEGGFSLPLEDLKRLLDSVDTARSPS